MAMHPVYTRLSYRAWLGVQRAVAVVMLVALLPIFAVLFLMVKLTSRGPFLYRQQRPAQQTQTEQPYRAKASSSSTSPGPCPLPWSRSGSAIPDASARVMVVTIARFNRKRRLPNATLSQEVRMAQVAVPVILFLNRVPGTASVRAGLPRFHRRARCYGWLQRTKLEHRSPRCYIWPTACG